MLQDALSYAKAGFPVFPLGVGAKEPAISLRDGGRGMLDATTDLNQVQAWWGTNPDWNIGIRPPEGVIVLDVDPRNGGDVESLGEIPPTLCTHTGTGGWHLYYRYVGKHRGKMHRHPGIDIKGHTGYVVAPPSIHPNGNRYEWFCKDPVAVLPARLIEFVRPPHMKMYIPDPDKLGDTSGLVKTVLNAPEGERNNTFHWACRRAIEEGSPLDDLAAAALSIGLTEREVHNTMNSARSAR